MSANLPKVIDEELLFCALCLRYYDDDPKILPCLHIFCKTCLVQHIEKLGKQASNKPPLPKKPTHLQGNSTVSGTGEACGSRSLPPLPQPTPNPQSPGVLLEGVDEDDHYEEMPQEGKKCHPNREKYSEILNRYEDLDSSDENLLLDIPQEVAPSPPPLSPHAYLPMDSRKAGQCFPPPVPKPRVKPKSEMDEGYEVPINTPSPPGHRTSHRNTVYIYDDAAESELRHSKSDWDLLSDQPSPMSRSLSLDEIETDLDCLVPCYYSEASPKLMANVRKKPAKSPPPDVVLPPRMVPLQRRSNKTSCSREEHRTNTNCGNVYTSTPSPKRVSSSQSISCPTCEQECILPDSGVSGFRTCSFVTSLRETVSAQSVSPRTCDNCDAKQAEFKCLECTHYLCSGCKQAHHWLKITKNHRVMTLKQLQSGKYQSEMLQRSAQHHASSCEVHRTLAAEFFCAQCDKAICEECRDSADHAGHNCCPLDVAATRDRQFLHTLVHTLQDREQVFEESARGLQEYQEKCTKERDELNVAITRQKEHIIKVLEEVCSELQRQVTSHYNAEISRTANVVCNNTHTAMRIKHAACLATQLEQHATPGHLVAMTTCLKQSINGDGRHEIRPEKLDHHMKLDFDQAPVREEELVALLGHCVRRQVQSARSPPPTPHEAFCKEKSHHTNGTPALLHNFRTKTQHDDKGCKPTGMAITQQDHLVLVDDINKKIKIFHENGTLIKELCPSGEGALIDPWDVAITKYGNFAVTDKGAGMVKIFDPEGDFVSSFGDHLKQPWGISTNSLGDIIVTDPVCHAVFVHDTGGGLKYSLGTGSHDGFFSCPEYVAVNKNDDIIVSDFQKHSVMIFDSIGRFLQSVGGKGRGTDEFNVPCGLTCDQDGNIYIADYNNQRVTQLDMNGRFLSYYLTMVDHLFWPQALGIDSSGRLLVIDGNSVKVFGEQGDNINMEVEIPPEPKPKTEVFGEKSALDRTVKLRREQGVEKLPQSPYLGKHSQDTAHLKELSPIQNMIETMTLVTPPTRCKSESVIHRDPQEDYDVPKLSQDCKIPPSRSMYDVPKPSAFNYSNTQYGVFEEEAQGKYETLNSSGSFSSENMMRSTEAVCGASGEESHKEERDHHVTTEIVNNLAEDKILLPTTKPKGQAKSKNKSDDFEREKPLRKSLNALTRRLSKQGKKKKLKELEKREAELAAEAIAAEEENISNISLEQQKDKGQI